MKVYKNLVIALLVSNANSCPVGDSGNTQSVVDEVK